MKKIIFLDIDGTLVDYEGKLPDSAREAVQAAQKNGHKIYMCTGRSKAELSLELLELGVNGMIGGNGSYVENDGEVILHQMISAEQTKRIVDWLKDRGLEFYLESNHGLFASENFEIAGEPVVQEYCRRKGQTETVNIAVRDIFPDMTFGGDLYRSDLNKVSFILNTYQDYLDAKAEFPDLNVGTWGGASEKALFGDFGVKDISKAGAIQVLLNNIGGKLEDTIAFGDARIDIPMLEYCAIGVAMGNAQEEVKLIADRIAGDVNEDGLFHEFEKLGLLN
ncbi:MAG: HAD family hydrolase [Eubacteriales bacterium]|nr:HAD family hydrolase [Eubacteriales bacterium]